MPLEGTPNIKLFSKDVELNLLHVDIFTSILSCLVYSGEGAIIVWHSVHYKHRYYILINQICNILIKLKTVLEAFK